MIGGTLPAALAADWLVSAWDQNTGMRYATPGYDRGRGGRGRAGCSTCSACRAASDVGFVTGGTMANFTGLAAGRQRGADAGPAGTSTRDGLTGAPEGAPCSCGEDRHATVDLSLRYLGLGAPTPVAADDAGPDPAGCPAPRRLPRSTVR